GPDQPALYAHALRLMTAARVKIHRPESALLLGKPPEIQPSPTGQERAYLAQFDSLAAKAETLESTNAFFPAMRMIGLLAQRRDGEAIAALHRAAVARDWRPYIAEINRTIQMLQEADAGIRPGIIELEPIVSTLFPHEAQLREASRIF